MNMMENRVNRILKETELVSSKFIPDRISNIFLNHLSQRNSFWGPEGSRRALGKTTMTTPSDSSVFGSRDFEEPAVLSPNNANVSGGSSVMNNNASNINFHGATDGDAMVYSSASGRSSRSNRSTQRSLMHIPPNRHAEAISAERHNDSFNLPATSEAAEQFHSVIEWRDLYAMQFIRSQCMKNSCQWLLS